MTSCWAAYAISISRCVVMPLFMWGRLLSLDFRGMRLIELTMVASRGSGGMLSICCGDFSADVPLLTR